MSYVRGFYMVTKRDGLTPIKVTVSGYSIIPTFDSYLEASRFANEHISGEYRVTEIAVGRA